MFLPMDTEVTHYFEATIIKKPSAVVLWWTKLIIRRLILLHHAIYFGGNPTCICNCILCKSPFE